MPVDLSRGALSHVVTVGSLPNGLLVTTLSCGTNGWLSSWGTNAHGEIAGCPPPVS